VIHRRNRLARRGAMFEQLYDGMSDWDGSERRRGGSAEELRARIEKLQREWREERERARVSSERAGQNAEKTRHRERREPRSAHATVKHRSHAAAAR